MALYWQLVPLRVIRRPHMSPCSRFRILSYVFLPKHFWLIFTHLQICVTTTTKCHTKHMGSYTLYGRVVIFVFAPLFSPLADPNVYDGATVITCRATARHPSFVVRLPNKTFSSTLVRRSDDATQYPHVGRWVRQAGAAVHEPPAPIPGYAMADSDQIKGNYINKSISWGHGKTNSLSGMAGARWW